MARSWRGCWRRAAEGSDMNATAQDKHRGQDGGSNSKQGSRLGLEYTIERCAKPTRSIVSFFCHSRALVFSLAHRRLKVAQLTTLISHRTVRFSPHLGSGIARGALRNAPDRRCQNTFAHPPADLLMAHSMLDVAHLRPGLLARSVMHRAQQCRRLAHHIEARPPLNEARELASRLSPQ